MKTDRKTMPALPGRIRSLEFAALAGLAGALAAPTVLAQATSTPAGVPDGVTFSIDVQANTAGTVEAFSGAKMSGADILTVGDGGAPGPNPAVSTPTLQPGVVDRWKSLGIVRYAAGSGFPTGAPRRLELDALSYGRDMGTIVCYSILEQSRVTDATMQTQRSAEEASADIFAFDPAGGTITHYLDGDGSSTRGFGLVEPNPDSFGLKDDGDNLDAVDIDTYARTAEDSPVYFSLDGAFVDRTEPGRHSGTAARNLVAAADVLVQTSPGAAFTVFASAASLGLTAGSWDTDHDDLDALALSENGNGTFDPFRPNPNGGEDFTWEPDYTQDVILFSVRAGSFVVGAICPRTGLPINEGDILTVPPAGGSTPMIVFPAEDLGLVTNRTHGSTKPSVSELDALDISNEDVMAIMNPEWSNNPTSGDGDNPGGGDTTGDPDTGDVTFPELEAGDGPDFPGL